MPVDPSVSCARGAAVRTCQCQSARRSDGLASIGLDPDGEAATDPLPPPRGGRRGPQTQGAICRGVAHPVRVTASHSALRQDYIELSVMDVFPGSAPDDAAPDYATPIVGWRTWRVVSRGRAARLLSPFYRTVWPTGRPLHAVCQSKEPLSCHEVPTLECACGIYAAVVEALDREIADVAFHGWPRLAIGQVALWGRVVQAERGWRGEFAYPEKLFVLEPRPADRRRAARAARALRGGYGVPVVVVPAPIRSLFDLAV
jgi:hypothetical protein